MSIEIVAIDDQSVRGEMVADLMSATSEDFDIKIYPPPSPSYTRFVARRRGVFRGNYPRDTHLGFVVRYIGFDEFFNDVGESDAIEKLLSLIAEETACTIEFLQRYSILFFNSCSKRLRLEEILEI
ncbi:hypothetical protein KAZ93_00570 [Patescibacteria group bacterium]|nr:hypothetical protein [Patescibacteria group bacterium]